MKKLIIKVIYSIIVFLIALFIVDALMNKGNTDMTMEMGKATFPLAYIIDNEQKINYMYGYIDEMQSSYLNEEITPVAADRSITIGMKKFGNTITSLSYEVRSADGERLVEKTKIEQYDQKEEELTANLKLKDLLELDTEYALCFLVTTSGGRSIRYYTKIILSENKYHAEDMIDFALNFNNKTFDKNNAKDLAKYLESNEEGDNTTYSKVDIHSSFSQITWGSLNVKKQMEPVVTMKESGPQISSIELKYMVSIKDGTDTTYYNVKEYYRIRFGEERMYLLDFERDMNQLFYFEPSEFTNNKISLGIADENVNLKESEDGNVFVFVREGRLFSFNLTSNKLALLFGFYDENNMDMRTVNDNFNIHIVSVDETGNVRFLVYGYMNRGMHEGQVGVTSYYYNSLLNTIEEEVFVPYTKSSDLLEQDIKQLVYVNNNNSLFLILDGTLYNIDLAMKSYTKVVENLSRESCQVSATNRMVVWQQGEQTEECDKLLLMNLNTGGQTEINAGSGKLIKPLGFMNEDLIYGVAYRTDISRDQTGSLIFPMYAIRIQNEKGDVLKNYEKSGIFVTDAAVTDNQIALTRVSRGEDGITYQETSEDQIMNDDIENTGKNTIETVPTEEYEKVIQIAAKSSFKASAIKYLTPRQVMYEGGRVLVLPDIKAVKEQYYVYDKHGIAEVLDDPADAIKLAEELSGKVLNDSGLCIYQKSSRSSVNQIMKIEAVQETEEQSGISICLEAMLKCEGITINAAYLLAEGENVFTILSDNLDYENPLDLSGCSLESVLYYVSRDIPVMALLNNGDAVLIVGYNELNTVLMDPSTGTIYKKGMKDSEEFFSLNGNQFITYIK